MCENKKRVEIEKKVLSENDILAGQIRDQLKTHGIKALNFVSSPGSGKTTLLEMTLRKLRHQMEIGLVAGDVQTENDAFRLVEAGGEAVQPIVTGGSCHLDARMVSRVLPKFNLADLDLLIFENVGNLVCPSGFDLGEDMKVVLLSTTEGDDKPLKYPAMFRRAGVMVITKIDLLDYTDFSLQRVRENALRINPALKIFELSCRSGDGLEDWYGWIKSLAKEQALV